MRLFGIHDDRSRRSIGRPIDDCPRLRTGSRRRLLACGVHALVFLLSLMSPEQSAAWTCTSGEKGTLVVRCAGGVCTEGFLIWHEDAYWAIHTCPKTRPMMADPATYAPSIQSLVEVLGVSMSTGIYEIEFRDRCDLRGESGTTYGQDFNDRERRRCLDLNRVRRLPAHADDPLEYELSRQRWADEVRAGVWVAWIEPLQMGFMGLFAELAATLLAVVMACLYLLGKRWALPYALPTQIVALVLIAWRFQSDYFELPAAIPRIDGVCFALVLLAIAVQAVKAIRSYAP